MSRELIERAAAPAAGTARTTSLMAAGLEPYGEPLAVPLSHYLWVLKRRRWRILALVTASVLVTLAISARMTPVYESTATIDIDRQTPPGVIGQEATRSTLNDADQFLATQMRLIQSDSVLRPVAARFHLLEHEGQTAGVAAGELGPAPVALQHLKVHRPPNTYLLLIGYRSTDPKLAASAANAIASSYLEHSYRIRYKSSSSLSSFMERQIEELKAKMERSSAALFGFERELNVVGPEEKTGLLSARLMQLNTEHTSAQSERVRREAAFRSVERGSLEAAEVSSQGEPLRKLAERFGQAQARFAEVRAQFGANHPEHRKAAAQMAEVERQIERGRQNITQRVAVEYNESLSREQMLAKAVRDTKAEFDRMNARSFEYQALKREAEADKKLYEELVRKIKEAGINASFQNSSIRIADPARPASKPVSPRTTLHLLLAFLASTLVAVGAAVVADVLDTTIRDPEQVSRTLQTEVIGSLPLVKHWRGRLGLPGAAKGGAVLRLGPASAAANGYDESIRTLRNSILLTDFDRRLRSLLVTSASPGEGKSTVACHLAASHAEQRQRTLLIDGDLRHPSVHHRFGLPNARGLSGVLQGEHGWREALVRPAALPDLDILPAGTTSRRGADLLGNCLLEVLDEALLEYDLVILDAPPLLGFAEPLEMATAVDGVVVVTRAGTTSRKAVATVLNTLSRLRANIVGVVLNQVHKEMSDSYTDYGYYGYYGKRDAAPAD